MVSAASTCGEHGSNNLGATNLYRVLGWKFAVPVALFDVAKGAIPVLLFGPQVPEVPLFPTLVRCDGGRRARVLGLRRLQGREGCRHGGGLLLGLAPGRSGGGW